MNKRATGKSTPGAPAIAAFLTTCLQLVAPLPAAAQTIDQLMSYRVKLESVDYQPLDAVQLLSGFRLCEASQGIAGEVAWTGCRLLVQGTTARLFVHGADQPALVVSDLKLGDSTGGVALWIGPGTEGYFTGLTIRPEQKGK